MTIRWNRVNRKVHYWGAVVCALPVVVILLTGLLLLLKKDIPWVQPPTVKGQGSVPALAFDKLLPIVAQVPQAQIESWADIDRIDVRPGKGVMKVRSKNYWEIQLDHRSGEVLQVAYRRSDIIEALHDGSFFHRHAKLGIFLPCTLILLLLWVSGLYLFFSTLSAKRRAKEKRQFKAAVQSPA